LLLDFKMNIMSEKRHYPPFILRLSNISISHKPHPPLTLAPNRFWLRRFHPGPYSPFLEEVGRTSFALQWLGVTATHSRMPCLGGSVRGDKFAPFSCLFFTHTLRPFRFYFFSLLLGVILFLLFFGLFLSKEQVPPLPHSLSPPISVFFSNSDFPLRFDHLSTRVMPELSFWDPSPPPSFPSPPPLKRFRGDQS